MAFTINSTVIGTQQIDGTSTTQNHALGTIVHGTDGTYGGGEFIYLKGVGSTVLGSWVTYNMDDGATLLLAANAIGAVGVSMSINVVGGFGWYQINGKAIGKAAAAYADNGLVFATATGGIVDDAVVIGDRVKNAIGASAVDTPSTGLAEFEINRPYMDDGTAA